MNKTVLAGQQLQCIRDERILFDQLSFQVHAGEILQIEGRNGSGKTSLLRILCGLALPSEGEVLWCGQSIERAANEFRSELIYVGHYPGVKADLTPLENLAFVRSLTAQSQAISDEQALAQFGLYGFEDVPTRTLSAGQQRRVALARLFVRQAQVWILDEPFTSLDKTAIKMLEQLIDNHAQSGGLVVLTSHHPVHCPKTPVLTLDLNASLG
ncbi:cytochrome c biogenesis heme-transporting ATPase CcmA [Thioflexithrix psekupsensis]|uniref:Heme ABC transporter ATP-binding protein CcmA n=1 Tax=Thioflexithrix psekupsensis TaxID=1570016 RepID=A0A251X5Q3_9GAMM|nr:cytochrome c biogenesis heme-transporting ATPase CcmA [Thioflexithrix psekupsensis]OUD12906.1 heme ABC transporter ATP-binding protein CcmA [Thioflexithrix psekupsensis]